VQATQKRGIVGAKGSELRFGPWLASTFPEQEFPVSPLHLGGTGLQQLGLLDTVKDTGCIINSPWRAMAHALIDFDAEKTADAVLEVATMPADSRSKPMIVIARGMGGGKTRALETLGST
jgi:hypothetical protein